MRVILNIEMETPDYDGDGFLAKFSALIDSIRKDSGDSFDALRVTKFKMRSKYEFPISGKDIDWKESERIKPRCPDCDQPGELMDDETARCENEKCPNIDSFSKENQNE